ncbi:MAG: haloacid dehalogenase-like hydrolase [Sporocytophaga sp.]|uniref:HAD family hydrolase n=1 Tax=Sporocytophaga sp. TaxID=2231183 RepID=UPI001B19CF9C|nr:HAD family hydrolase [Sporocytophaga sp.]MBO9702240.1 haloacid dehalogenase-like hydrolase [Sporocytophaga sp.]
MQVIFSCSLLFGCNKDVKEERVTQDSTPPAIKQEAFNESDPLPSWNDGKIKDSIISFVKLVTKEGPSFVKEEDRIAVFDNDGTLWVEQPTYSQVAFAINKVSLDHPEWKNREPFKSLMQGNMELLDKGGELAVMEIVMDTHAGMTTEEFEQEVLAWTTTAKHPRFDKPYTECVYQPMLELLTYLRTNGFKTFIVSGGGIEFMRPWSQKVYGVSPEQVIGSSIKTKYEVKDGMPELFRQRKIDFIDDKAGKPEGINSHIGKRPIAAFGNSDGDFQMLEWTTKGKGPTLGVIVHHDDAEREWAYDRKSPVGKLDKALNAASNNGWFVVSMKDDWKKIFSWDK